MANRKTRSSQRDGRSGTATSVLPIELLDETHSVMPQAYGVRDLAAQHITLGVVFLILGILCAVLLAAGAFLFSQQSQLLKDSSSALVEARLLTAKIAEIASTVIKLNDESSGHNLDSHKQQEQHGNDVANVQPPLGRDQPEKPLPLASDMPSDIQ